MNYIVCEMLAVPCEKNSYGVRGGDGDVQNNDETAFAMPRDFLERRNRKVAS
jgi:hypothetical protein